MSIIAYDIAVCAMMAEEALCSSEIEGIRLSPRNRFITKCMMIWPGLSKKDLGLVYDHMQNKTDSNDGKPE